jgi:hypothetical protein
LHPDFLSNDNKGGQEKAGRLKQRRRRSILNATVKRHRQVDFDEETLLHNYEVVLKL